MKITELGKSYSAQEGQFRVQVAIAQDSDGKYFFGIAHYNKFGKCESSSTNVFKSCDTIEELEAVLNEELEEEVEIELGQ